MREIFYIPEGGIVNDYKEHWEGITSIVQVGLSANIEEYVSNPELAQLILIPEYKNLDTPRNISNLEYFQCVYFDDFETIKQEKPEVYLQVWSKNLDNPAEEHVLIQTYPMHYEVGRKCFITDHMKLSVGWYDMVVLVDKQKTEERTTTVYEMVLEEE